MLSAPLQGLYSPPLLQQHPVKKADALNTTKISMILFMSGPCFVGTLNIRHVFKFSQLAL